MPWKSEKIKLPEEYDRRCKLTQDKRDKIKELYATGMYSMRQLAKEYGVDKSYISLLVNPDRAAKVKANRKANAERYKVDKEERNRIMREYRQRKQRLYLEGKIGNETDKQ